jgi:putative component of membrane protein insertase Oxa1/YidC/SpoIIIJ protein YidD
MFSWIFSKLIERYWATTPPENRKVCLFRESCSVAVHRELNNAGFLCGLRLFWFRYWNCKPGYRVEVKGEQAGIRTVRGYLIEEQNMNPLLLREIKTTI